MPTNFPGPYEVEYTYTAVVGSLTLNHFLRVNCMALDDPTPGTPMDEIEFATIGGTPVNAETAIATLWNWISLQLSTSSVVLAAVLNRYATGTFSKDFVSAYAGTPLAGANGAGAADAHQMVQTFRSANGGIMKLTILEDVNGSLKTLASNIANPAGSDDQKLSAYILSSAGWLLARDDGFPIAPLHQAFGENEAIWRKRHR